MERPHKLYRKQHPIKHRVNIQSKKCVKQRQTDYTILLLYSLLFKLANTAWGSTHKTKVHKTHIRQKHTTRLICNENNFTHSKPLMRFLQVLYVIFSHKYVILC